MSKSIYEDLMKKSFESHFKLAWALDLEGIGCEKKQSIYFQGPCLHCLLIDREKMQQLNVIHLMFQ